MALERTWTRQGPIAFTANGGQDGLVTVADVLNFKVKQTVVLSSNTQPDLRLEVKRVLSLTTLIVGPLNNQKGGNRSLNTKTDISAFTVADSATIRSDEQPKSVPTPNDIIKAVYEQEPTLAIRTFQVDRLGNPIGSDSDNPMHVQLSDGDVNIGTVNAELEVQLSHQDNVPDAGDVADSVQIGDGTRTALISALQELTTSDILNNGFIDTVITVSAGGVVELKVGANKKTNRKMAFWKPRAKDVSFGGSNTTQSFIMAKDQFFFVPVGESTEIWFKNNGASDANIEIGEF